MKERSIVDLHISYMTPFIKKDEDVSQYVYEYSLKGAKKIM